MSTSDASQHAWLLRKLGAPTETLSWERVTPRPAGPGEARVAVEAAGCNFPDLLVCAGRYQEHPVLPFTPGFEAAGTVVEAGPGAGVAEGERVVVVTDFPEGAFQESLTVPASQLLPIPDEMPAETAAILHIAYTTAHVAVHRRGRLQPGETLLVTGAAGGVGSAAVQLGRLAGGRVVAVVRGEDKAEAARRFGAHAVVDLAAPDRWGKSLFARVLDVTEGHGADVVVDVVGGGRFDDLRRCVGFEGRLVVVGFTAGAIPALPTNHVLLRNYSVVGVHLARYRTEDPSHLRQVHDELVDLVGRGLVTPHLHAVLPMEDLLEALSLVAGRHVIGRVAVRTGR